MHNQPLATTTLPLVRGNIFSGRGIIPAPTTTVLLVALELEAVLLLMARDATVVALAWAQHYKSGGDGQPHKNSPRNLAPVARGVAPAAAGSSPGAASVSLQAWEAHAEWGGAVQSPLLRGKCKLSRNTSHRLRTFGHLSGTQSYHYCKPPAPTLCEQARRIAPPRHACHALLPP